jgi:hypothetical protein
VFKQFVRKALAAAGAVVVSLTSFAVDAAVINPIVGINSTVTSAAAINDAGVVTGIYGTNFEYGFGFRFTIAGGMEALPMPPGTNFYEPHAISENGIIVGQASSGAGEVLARTIGNVSSNLGAPAGYNIGAIGYGVNNTGTVAVHGMASGGVTNGFRYTDAAGFEILGSKVITARAINNAGTIAGNFVDANNNIQGYRLPASGSIQGTGHLQGQNYSEGRAVNSNDSVAGDANYGSGSVATLAAVSVALSPRQANMQNSFALGINDTNWTVGYQYDGSQAHATLWRPNGVRIDLNQWLAQNDPALAAKWRLQEARDINNLGFIVGEGLFTDSSNNLSRRGFILDAQVLIPEPAMGTCAIVLLAALRRRR